MLSYLLLLMVSEGEGEDLHFIRMRARTRVEGQPWTVYNAFRSHCVLSTSSLFCISSQ